MQSRRSLVLALISLAIFFLAGASAVAVFATVTLPDADASQPGASYAIRPDVRIIRLTLTAAHNGLTAIRLRVTDVASDPTTTVRVSAHLSLINHTGVGQWVDGEILVERNSTRLFRFAPIPDSAGKQYLLELAVDSPADELPGFRLTPEDWYPDGVLELNNEPAPGDLAFQSYYATRVTDRLLVGIAMLASNAKPAFAALALLVLPGLLLDILGGLRLGSTIGTGPTFAAWIALSSGLVGLRRMALTRQLWGPGDALLGIVVLGLSAFRFYRWHRGRDRQRHRCEPDLMHAAQIGREVAALALLFGLALVARFAQVAEMTVPAWVDGLEHAQRVEALSASGAFLASYYHYGFHFIVADVLRLMPVTAPTAILATGQVISALVPLVVYGWARDLGLPKLSAWATALAVGFVSVMPAYYTYWGRYPLLLGWLVLPGTVILASRVLDSQPGHRLLAAQVGGLSIALVGTLLAHSRMAAYLLLALAAVAIYHFLTGSLRARNLALMAPSSAIAAGIMGGWLLSFTGASGGGDSFNQAERALRGCWDAVGLVGRVLEATPDLETMLFVVLGLVGLVLGTLQRRPVAITVLIWSALMVIAANLPPRTPGCGFINNYTLAISLFLPVSLGLGQLVDTVIGLVNSRINAPSSDRPITARRLWVSEAWGSVLLLVIAWTLGYRLLGNPDATMVLERTADQRAIAWISDREHVPTESVFLVNTFEWLPGQYQPSDAGGWLPNLAGRSVALAASKAAGKALRQGQGDIGSLCQTARAAGVTHLYLGRRGGVIAPSLVSAVGSCFEEIYTTDGVRIYRLF